MFVTLAAFKKNNVEQPQVNLIEKTNNRLTSINDKLNIVISGVTIKELIVELSKGCKGHDVVHLFVLKNISYEFISIL